MKQFTITQKATLSLVRKNKNIPRATLVFKNKTRYSRKKKNEKADSYE